MMIPLEVSEDAIPRTFREDQFRSIVSTVVGNAASESDGFAGLMRVPLDAIADAENLLPTLDTHAGEIADAAQPLSIEHEAAASAQLAETVKAGDAEAGAFDGHFGDGNQPIILIDDPVYDPAAGPDPDKDYPIETPRPY